MAARRCAMCAVDFDTEVTDCPLCEEKTTYFSNVEPDAHWREEVARRQAQSTAPDPVDRWREAELVRAGYDPEAARLIATRREVDLHEAVALARQGCEVTTALRILL